MSTNTAAGKRLVYLCGIAGHPELSPAMQALAADGWEIVTPDVLGFNGKSFTTPDEYLDWLTVFWDALDETGALPCPVIGASVGGMIAAELAALRPESVTKLALLAPFGIGDGANPGFDVYAIPAAERMAHLFAKGVPEAFVERFSHLGTEEGPVARYLSDVAAATLVWPLGERGLGKRLHRLPSDRLTVWGELDELIPVDRAAQWTVGASPANVLVGAGHLLEWDAPEETAALLRAFLAS